MANIWADNPTDGAHGEYATYSDGIGWRFFETKSEAEASVRRKHKRGDSNIRFGQVRATKHFAEGTLATADILLEWPE